MNDFNRAMDILSMDKSVDIREVDISSALDGNSKRFVECVTTFLKDVIIIRCTHSNLNDWTKSGVFIEVVAETNHDSDFATLFNIAEEFFGKCVIEPTSDIMVTSSDDNIAMAINESLRKTEYYCIYRR